jgi:hypothetical protein
MAMYEHPTLVRDGGLMAYGPDAAETANLVAWHAVARRRSDRVSVATLSGGRMYSCWRRGNLWQSHSARSKPNGDSNQRLGRYLRPRFGIVANKIG